MSEQAVGGWWATMEAGRRPSVLSASLLALALLSGCGLNQAAACVDGVEFDDHRYDDYASQSPLPTDGELGQGRETKCGNQESDPLTEQPIIVLRLRGVDPDIAVVVDGRLNTLWVNSKLSPSETPKEVSEYIK